MDRYGLHYALERVITYSSKVPRPNEQHGRDYHFISREEFELKITQGFFLEWSGAYEENYGSPCHILGQILEEKSFLLIIDRLGAQQILKKYPAAVPIWIYTRSIDDLRSRLISRNTELIEQIERRMNRAKEEILAEINDPLYRYHVLNDDFDQALERIFTIIKRELF